MLINTLIGKAKKLIEKLGPVGVALSAVPTVINN
ncbi:hypothetical protein SAMN04488168_1143 [Bacillus sp. 491mf]|nr:hypothetical protein SAMN04488168_1143 [Bacillus sp. 491mf]